MHGNDPEQSLASLAAASVGAASSVHRDLQEVTDPDLQATLDRLLPGPTGSAAARSVGASSASGQRFQILRPHARGGLGQVSVALDKELNREVALKEIQDRHADNLESRARFLLEGEITGGLEHPGIVPVYGLGTDGGGRPFYAMRFIKGDSMKEAIESFHHFAPQPGSDDTEEIAPRATKRRPRPLAAAERFGGSEFRQLLRRFVDVCNAIQYAHDRGVLHRDLKPANIMLGKYGETLVVDWGLAKAVGHRPVSGDGAALPPEEITLRPTSASGSVETQAGSAMGTPAYMSPEQAKGQLDVLGPASDIYSLGATLYSLLTGRPPLEGGDVAVLLANVQLGEFPPPRRLNKQIPAALDAVCRKAMALAPNCRYETALDLAADVEHWLADEPVAAYPESLKERVLRWCRRRPVAAIGAAFLAALDIAVVGAILAAFVWQGAFLILPFLLFGWLVGQFVLLALVSQAVALIGAFFGFLLGALIHLVSRSRTPKPGAKRSPDPAAAGAPSLLGASGHALRGLRIGGKTGALVGLLGALGLLVAFGCLQWFAAAFPGLAHPGDNASFAYLLACIATALIPIVTTLWSLVRGPGHTRLRRTLRGALVGGTLGSVVGSFAIVLPFLMINETLRNAAGRGPGNPPAGLGKAPAPMIAPMGIATNLSMLPANRTAQDRLTETDRDPSISPKLHKTYLCLMNVGTTYIVRLDSDDFDAYLELADLGHEKILASDDNSGGGMNARFTFTSQQTKLYRILVTSAGGQTTGNFSLRVEP